MVVDPLGVLLVVLTRQPTTRITIAGLSASRTLNTLILQDCDISHRIMFAVKQRLEGCSTLTKLDLSNNSIGVEGVGQLRGLVENCSNLTSLRFGVSPATQREFARHKVAYLWPELDSHLAVHRLCRTLEICKEMSELVVRNVMIRCAGAEAISNCLRHWPNLAHLEIQHGSIKEHGATQLAQGLKSCPSLLRLILPYNLVGDKGVGVLSNTLSSLQRLEHLNLSATGFSKRGTR
mmetsp:Transcript_38410/g.59940  ORF Transcript_38410/g.59940 Transcript_38410/m.59940 type:complete len:235 (+) Transcript_38410:2435-3139(+)